MRHHPDLLLVRYEDLREDTPRELGRVLAFMGTPGEPEQVKEAVEFASIENMREQERRGTFSGHGRRMRPGDPDDPNSFKVRKASVGGYRGEFDDATLAEIDARVEASLDPVYGYTRPPS